MIFFSLFIKGYYFTKYINEILIHMLVIARYLVQYDNTLRFFHILYLIHEFLRGLAEWIKS